MRQTTQPARHTVFLDQDWSHRYHAVRIIRGSDGRVLEVPASSALDFNPRWLVDRIVETKGDARFTLNLGTTNDIDLVLRRAGQLRERYPDTFRQVILTEPVARLLDGIADLDLTVHVHTLGEHLREESIRRSLLRSAVTVRASVGETDVDVMRALVAERDAAGRATMLGLSMVCRKADVTRIVPFAELARDIGCDFVTFHQEGRFSREEARRLATVEAMQDEDFAVNVSRPPGDQYHDSVERLLVHLDGELDWDCELVPRTFRVPASVEVV